MHISLSRSLCASAMALLLSTALVLPAQSQNTAQTTPAADYTILSINGDTVKRSEVEAIWSSVFPQGTAPSFDEVDDNVKQNILRGIVGEYLLFKKAVESNLETDPDVKRALENARKKTLVEAFLEKKAAGQVTNAAVQAEYAKQQAAIGDEMEVRASHILVKEEDTAKMIKRKLDSGIAFNVLAKEHSVDKASAVSGGDLGYFTRDRMVEDFADAAYALNAGELSDPVKTDFGWHIIKVVDKRKRQMPPLTEVRPAIEKKLQANVLAEYINNLVGSATVHYYTKDGEKTEIKAIMPPKKDDTPKE